MQSNNQNESAIPTPLLGEHGVHDPSEERGRDGNHAENKAEHEGDIEPILTGANHGGFRQQLAAQDARYGEYDSENQEEAFGAVVLGVHSVSDSSIPNERRVLLRLTGGEA
jgi:hypothetical protein